MNDETVILPIGTRVRSYDFPGDQTCYVEGVVDGYGGDVFPSDAHYRIVVDKTVWMGVPDETVSQFLKVVYPPFDGSLGVQLVFAL